MGGDVSRYFNELRGLCRDAVAAEIGAETPTRLDGAG
jgi:hypothetical protein